MADKSLVVTYLLWLTLGWFGVHHFYLRRDRHAFVWLWTLGGCCGIGWILELFRLHSYVELSNGYGYETKRQAVQISKRQSPELAWKRFAGELSFSVLLGFISAAAVPEELQVNWRLTAAISSFFAAVGVHTVANIGNERCSFGVCLVGAFLPLPSCLLSSADSLATIITYSAVTCSAYSNWIGKQWKPLDLKSADSQLHVCTRLVIFASASVVLGTMITSTLYFNCHVTTRDGQRVRFRDAIPHIVQSPFWKDTWQTVKRLYHSLVDDGLQSLWIELNLVLDPEGEESAYRTLNLTSSANQKEITERYRHLVKLYHPDKVHSDSDLDRQKAHQRFIQIEQAYGKLSTIRQRRSENTKRNEL